MIKGLEALENLVNREIIIKYKDKNIDFYWNDESSQDYKIIEKSLKTLEIIKIHRIYVRGLLSSNVKCADDYNRIYCDNLTEEEYDLLKEILYD